MTDNPHDAPVPEEGYDQTHPEHLDFVRETGRCFAPDDDGPCLACDLADARAEIGNLRAKVARLSAEPCRRPV